MKSWSRLLLAIVVLTGIVFVAAILYQLGMTHLEGKPRTFLQAFSWASETVSTTGYGSDSTWTHPLMIVLVASVQIIGVVSVPLIVALFMVPFLSQQFERRVPRVAPARLRDHVLIYRYGPTVESLVETLRAEGIEALVVETDETRAREVMESGQNVVFTRTDESVPEVGQIELARAVVANGSDQENAALVLRARQAGFTREIDAFVEEPSHRAAMEIAGASKVFTPRHIVAAALAKHASDVMTPRLPGLGQIAGIVRREVRIPATSPYAGRTFGEVRIPAVIAGMWHRSHLHSRCSGDVRIESGSILDLVGTDETIAESVVILGGVLLRNSGFYLIAGFGEVGRKVHELLVDVGEDVRVVERNPAPDVDVVGDVLDASVLRRAGIAECRSLILALDSDDSTLFATVIARDEAPDVSVLARVNHSANLNNIYRAGADFALSISDISADMLSSKILGRAIRQRDEHRNIVSMEGTRFAGRLLADVSSAADGVSILATEREGAVVLPSPGFRIAPSDRVWLCGSPEALGRIAGRT